MNILKNVLLIGGGHAHIQVIHQLARLKREKFQVTFVSDVGLAPYSGMIPSFMAGHYQSEDLEFDLEAICRRFNFIFIKKSVVKIDADQNLVFCSDGQSLRYDICSINIGIRPKFISSENPDSVDVIYLKPISRLIDKWRNLISNFSRADSTLDITIIGGGAAAFETSIACRKYFKNFNSKIRIITGHKPLLNEQGIKAQKLAHESLKSFSIECIEGRQVSVVRERTVVLDDGTEIPRQIIFVGVSAEAPNLFRESGLPVNVDGFVKVDEFLQVLSYSNLFAAGDCCEFNPRTLPKSGVFAVREGPILFENIKAKIFDKNNNYNKKFYDIKFSK